MQRSLISNLGSQEVLEYSELIDLELHDEGLFLVKAKAGKVADGSGLVEHVEVAESELLRHRLFDLEDSSVLALLGAVVLTKLN